LVYKIRSYAYHGAHPFTVPYWAAHALDHLGYVILVGGDPEITNYMASSAPTATLRLWRGGRTPSAEFVRDLHTHLAAVYVRRKLAAGRLRGFRALIPFRLVEQREGETCRVKPSSEPRPDRNSARLQVESKRDQTNRKGC
jgi:hypothetical protein